MNLNIEIFKELTTRKAENPSINLLEGAYFYINAFKLIEIIKSFREMNIEFSIFTGFKGKSNFEKCNKFKSLIYL